LKRPGILSIAALALVAALAGAPAAAAAAKPRTEVTPASRTAFLTARGTDGWRLQITAVLGSAKGTRQPIGFFARGPHREEVSYVGGKGRASEDGEIVGKLPGIGRVDLRFEQISKQQVTFGTETDCKTEGKSAVLKGVFRGTIEFHGEGGYTTVERRSAPGTIEVHPRTICHRPRHQPPPQADKTGFKLLVAERDEGHGESLTFDAFGADLKPSEGGSISGFAASYTHKRGKLLIVASTRAASEEATSFSLTAPEGTPSEATVAPPAPFSGTATFKLESPTAASWTGDLSVEIPTLGTVDLTEPGFRAGACAANCTKTFPHGMGFGIVGISRLS
jgi:hypothetical protein